MKDAIEIIHRRWGARAAKEAERSLGRYLPDPWDDGRFDVVRAGGHWGLRLRCPRCEVTPPRELKGSGARRWRWLTVHLTECK